MKLSKAQQEIVGILKCGGHIEYSVSQDKYWIVEDKSNPWKIIGYKTFEVLNNQGWLKLHKEFFQDILTDPVQECKIGSQYVINPGKIGYWEKSKEDRIEERIGSLSRLLNISNMYAFKLECLLERMEDGKQKLEELRKEYRKDIGREEASG